MMLRWKRNEEFVIIRCQVNWFCLVIPLMLYSIGYAYTCQWSIISLTWTMWTPMNKLSLVPGLTAATCHGLGIHGGAVRYCVHGRQAVLNRLHQHVVIYYGQVEENVHSRWWSDSTIPSCAVGTASPLMCKQYAYRREDAVCGLENKHIGSQFFWDSSRKM
jgi:hypothetical protein